MAVKTPEIYQASDLQKRYRDVLKDARARVARLRDKDGTSLVMMREAYVSALEELSEATATFMILEQSLATPGREPSLADLGAWPWVRFLDPEDRLEFLQEMRVALVMASREHNAEQIQQTVGAWKTTAESLSDSTRRSILLGPVTENDMIPAERPTDVKRLPTISTR
jgi:hypothetical protein